jgi:DNA-binding transcriptional MerR regulator
MMDIAEVIKKSCLPASSLRFYEEKGLISSIGRKGLRRQYHEGVVVQLALITLARRAGFSLTEIAEILMGEHAGERHIRRDALLAKAEELDQQIQELIAMREGLRHAAACPAPNHFECPKFLRLLKLASKTRSRKEKVEFK